MAVANAPPADDGRRPVSLAAMQDAFARKALLYDKAGEEHFNIISALHKSIRNSDADAGLYWLARMLEAGEDPLVRRAPAGAVRVRGRRAWPTRRPWWWPWPRSRPSTSWACRKARWPWPSSSCTSRPPPRATPSTSRTARRPQDALTTRAEPVPLWIRNAPTPLMKQLGYGRGYRYAHDEEAGVAEMESLPEALRGPPLLPADRPRRGGGSGRAAGGGAAHPPARAAGSDPASTE